ncbi:transporter substrate-binding protein [Paracoccus sp. SCSIO 75233]|uniref:transporter substrate-binding protein n=1 Tax=Paracoccus sp. SCSIO 75233 TaxID=3017782 RepID=UPI0022F115BE|nr:transporter substrate-binding protein [Paracoccus sp. SCSIO 75233]WBU54472.1 transporter substrate-binding protein [Paracoccus sp. SCSIO 75233]
MKRKVHIGILLSHSGDYSMISRSSLRGALAGIDQVNADPSLSVHLVPVERDPKGQVDLYAPLCSDILSASPARHIFGCTTSWSRKEVLPVLERAGASLWYGIPHEGFEASAHVAYMHACANQHLLPLLDWAMPRFGRRVHLVASNYIWGWEIDRLARELVTTAGGEITGERHLSIAETDVNGMVDDIAAARPDFVLNSLIASSQYAFLREMKARLPDIPILSCNLTECELPMIGDSGEGVIAAGPYFHEPGTQERFANSHEAAGHAAIMEMARLFHRHPGGEAMTLSDLLALDAGGGPVDPQTHHVSLPVLIGEVRDGGFRVVHRMDPVPGDPYLTRPDRLRLVRPSLKLVK